MPKYHHIRNSSPASILGKIAYHTAVILWDHQSIHISNYLSALFFQNLFRFRNVKTFEFSNKKRTWPELCRVCNKYFIDFCSVASSLRMKKKKCFVCSKRRNRLIRAYHGLACDTCRKFFERKVKDGTYLDLKCKRGIHSSEK